MSLPIGITGLKVNRASLPTTRLQQLLKKNGNQRLLPYEHLSHDMAVYRVPSNGNALILEGAYMVGANTKERAHHL